MKIEDREIFENALPQPSIALEKDMCPNTKTNKKQEKKKKQQKTIQIERKTNSVHQK